MSKMPMILTIGMLFASAQITSAPTYDTYLSEEIQGYCVEIGDEYNVCPELLISIIEHESSGNAKAENGNCKGLMQVSTKWHEDRMERLGVTDIYDEYGNILVGTDYLIELFENYGDVGIVLMAYNGDSRTDDYLQGNCGLSTYAERVLKRSEQLERTRGK